MQPRFLRLRDAPDYLGMDRNRFNTEVRPCLINIKIGLQGVAFDRFDLDQWANAYKQQYGLPAKRKMQWNANVCHQDSSNTEGDQSSTSSQINLDHHENSNKKPKSLAVEKRQSSLPAKRRTRWDANVCQGSSNADPSGTSIKKSEVREFQKVLEQVILKKQKDT